MLFVCRFHGKSETAQLLKKARAFINGKKEISVRDNEPHSLWGLARGRLQAWRSDELFFLDYSVSLVYIFCCLASDKPELSGICAP
jgi:hypothetical protein